MSLKQATIFLICLFVAGSSIWAGNIEVITMQVLGMT